MMLLMELAVLVPVLNRPQNVAPLVESFLAGCPADSYLDFLVDVDDTAEWETVKAVTDWQRVGWHQATGSWPKRINFGALENEADWYLCAADDIRFTPGWWEATAGSRGVSACGVIGTNDQMLDGTGGNPRVQTSDLTIHPLVRATYIRDYGTIDEPGKVVHDGYHHWCCDDELLWTAKIRGAYAYCPDAHIEHLHPYWGHGQMDATYRAGEANAEADLALWKSRAPLLGLQVQ